MAGHSCHNCVYSVCDPDLWLRLMWAGEPIVPRCAHHPQWPGQLHEVPGVPCRNYRPKPLLPQGDNVRLIPLGDGAYACVDATDYEWLNRYNWRLVNGYTCRRENDKSILMHREIMQAPEGMVVDHIDCNRVNNCRFNLRVCTPAENQCNQRKRRGSRSRFKGIYYDKNCRKWSAECRFAGKRHRLGYFDDEEAAARAYDYKAVECFGIFARVNFPEEWPPQRRQEVYAEHSHTADSSSARIRTAASSSPCIRTAGSSSPRLRRGESSFAHSSAAPQKAKGKKAGRKEAKTTPPAGKASAKTKNKKPHAKTPRRRDRKRTAKRPPQKPKRHEHLRQKKGPTTGQQR